MNDENSSVENSGKIQKAKQVKQDTVWPSKVQYYQL